MRGLLGVRGPISDDFVTTVHERTEGNPFFVEELVRTLVATGEMFYADGRWDRKAIASLEVPATIQEAILRRVRRLDGDAQAALRVAAVLGQRFGAEPVAELAGLPDDAVLEALRALVDAQLVGEDSASGGFRFRHALTRDTVYGQLLGPERRKLHRETAAVLERLHSDRLEEYAAELAFHYRAAELGDRARELSILAGHRAARLGAPADARVHFGAALAASGRRSERAELLLTLGQLSFCATGHLTASIAELEESARLFHADGDARAEARALLDLSHSALMNGERARALEIRRAVLALLEPLGESEELAAAYRALGHYFMLGGAHADAVVWSERALTLSRRLGAGRITAEALNDLGASLAHGAERERGVTLLRESLAISLEHEWAPEAGRAYVNLGNGLLISGRYDEALAVSADGIAFCRRTGNDFSRLICVVHVAWLHRLAGRWDEAETHLDEILAAAAMEDSKKYLLMGLAELAQLRGHQGRWDDVAEALRQLEPLAVERDELQHLAPLRTVAARLHVARNELDKARHELEVLRAYWHDQSDDPVHVGPAFALACELTAAAGARDDANAFLADLRAIAAVSASPETPLCLAEAESALETARGEPGAAAAALGRAVEGWTALGRPYDRARAQRLLGEALLHVDGERAEQAFHDARRTFSELGATHDLKLTDSSLRRAGLPVPRGPREATRQGPGGLTPREVEVVRLIAEGKTNAQIARELVVSTKTAGAHVSNILAKLGFSSRSQVARWAAEQHLVQTA